MYVCNSMYVYIHIKKIYVIIIYTIFTECAKIKKKRRNNKRMRKEEEERNKKKEKKKVALKKRK